MCTVNSLAEAPQRLYLKLSHGTAALAMYVLLSSGSSIAQSAGAGGVRQAMANFTVTAPPDITVTIRDSARCDTTLILPPALCGGCMGGEQFSTSSVFATINTNGGPMNFHTGSYEVIYTVSNTVGMTGRDTMRVTVFDNHQPNAVCKSQLNIFINNAGEAEIPASLLDAGSSDNCGHIYFKAKLMFAPSGFTCHTADNPHHRFDDELKFCCQYLDSAEVMVRLRIYDAYPGHGPVSESFLFGHFTECMVRVQVLDKLPPEVICPTPVTITCGADIDSALNAHRPVLIDNCSALQVDTSTRYRLNACGIGTVERRFTARDRMGLSSSCLQIIHVTGVSDFDGLDTNQLKWPPHLTLYACRISLDAIPLTEPRIVEDECNNVVSYYRDEIYQFTRGGVCAKVLRHWEVIDWCRYDRRLPNPKVPSNGYYAYVQEIKILDTVPPLISGLGDTVIAVLSDRCSPGFAAFPTLTAEDCGSTSQVRMWFEIDFFADGSVDRRVEGFNPSGLYPHGTHVLKIYASDSCHNQALKKVRVTIKDGKKPEAKILTGIATNISRMPAGNMVSINARLFDEGSSDNCTPPDRLRFSFSEDIHDTVRVFDCSQLGRNDVAIYVWDECLNYSLVITFLVVSDINDVCTAGIQTIAVYGSVKTHTDLSVPEVDVYLQASGVQRTYRTDGEGRFAFENIRKYADITVQASEKQDHLRGISTADLVLIQREILQPNSLSSPYLLLAADVNQNGQITAHDIALLRSLLLGKTSALPGGEAYIFMDKHYRFADVRNPFKEYNVHRAIVVPSVGQDLRVELVAIKLGDVNASLTFGGIAAYQETTPLYWEADGHYLNVRCAGAMAFQALQFGLRSNQMNNAFVGLEGSDLPDLTDEHIWISGNRLRLSYNAQREIAAAPGFLIARFRLAKPVTENSIVPEVAFAGEVFRADGNLSGISWEAGQEMPVRSFGVEFFPNPANDFVQMRAYTPAQGELEVEIFAGDGKRVWVKQLATVGGSMHFTLPAEVFPCEGVYAIKCRAGDQIQVRKIIIKR